MNEADIQINTLKAMEGYEEADIEFLLVELNLLDSFAARTAVRSFRKQMIVVAAGIASQCAFTQGESK